MQRKIPQQNTSTRLELECDPGTQFDAADRIAGLFVGGSETVLANGGLIDILNLVNIERAAELIAELQNDGFEFDEVRIVNNWQ